MCSQIQCLVNTQQLSTGLSFQSCPCVSEEFISIGVIMTDVFYAPEIFAIINLIRE